GDIAGEGTRASEIIARVRTMLRKGAAERQLLDLNDVAREVAELIRRDLAARRLSVDLLLAENLPPVRGDRVQLQQVLLNLLSNGADAIEAAGGGRRQLEIRTELIAPATVLVSVQDSGIGLSPENAERVFEQFYTTKPRGLGIGLSICRSIVTAH